MLVGFVTRARDITLKTLTCFEGSAAFPVDVTLSQADDQANSKEVALWAGGSLTLEGRRFLFHLCVIYRISSI